MTSEPPSSPPITVVRCVRRVIQQIQLRSPPPVARHAPAVTRPSLCPPFRMTQTKSQAIPGRAPVTAGRYAPVSSPKVTLTAKPRSIASSHGDWVRSGLLVFFLLFFFFFPLHRLNSTEGDVGGTATRPFHPVPTDSEDGG